jgi:hypothetical protein
VGVAPTSRVTLAERISRRSREKKFRLFMELMRPGPETRVLDVGVDDLGFGQTDAWTTANFFEEFYPWRENLTALAPHEEGASASATRR